MSKSDSMRYLSVVLAVLLIGSIFYSCQNKREKRAEKFTERILEKAGGENVDVSVDGESITIKTDEGTIIANTGDKSWPKDIPGDVPEFKYGKMENVSLRDLDETKIWTMLFEKVPGDVLESYQKKLKSKGFETNLIGRTGVGGMLTGEKDELNIAVMAGEGNASLSVTFENE